MKRWEVLLELLRPALAPDRPEDVVRRIDPGRDGSLYVQLDRAGSRSWVEVQGRRVLALTCADDRRLPLLTARPHAEARDALSPLDEHPLAWYPGRRVVLRGIAEGRPTIVKGYRKGRSELAAQRHRLAIRASAGGPLGVPSLVGHHATTSALEFEHLRGRQLDGADREPGNLFRIGLGLRWFQRQREDVAELPVHDQRAELGTLDTLARRATDSTDRLPTTWHAVRAELEAWGQDLPAPQLCLAHRDLHDRQVLVDGEDLWWIDFDLMSLADPLLDAANLSAHLLLRGLQHRDGLDEVTAERLGGALLDGLDRYEAPDFWARLRFYQATTFLRLAAVYAMRPRWMAHADDLVHYARRCLMERSHA